MSIFTVGSPFQNGRLNTFLKRPDGEWLKAANKVTATHIIGGALWHKLESLNDPLAEGNRFSLRLGKSQSKDGARRSSSSDLDLNLVEPVSEGREHPEQWYSHPSEYIHASGLEIRIDEVLEVAQGKGTNSPAEPVVHSQIFRTLELPSFPKNPGTT